MGQGRIGHALQFGYTVRNQFILMTWACVLIRQRFRGEQLLDAQTQAFGKLHHPPCHRLWGIVDGTFRVKNSCSILKQKNPKQAAIAISCHQPFCVKE